MKEFYDGEKSKGVSEGLKGKLKRTDLYLFDMELKLRGVSIEDENDPTRLD